MRNLNYFSLSYIGQRDSNEDFFYAGEISPGSYFFAVADGMGGGPGGEIASKKVIQSCINFLKSKITVSTDASGLKVIIAEMYSLAQDEIRIQVTKDNSLRGMGTTLSCLIIHNKKYVWGNIGDSRIYRLKNDEIRLITKDHSYLQEYIDEHGGTVDFSMETNYGHLVTRIINGGNDRPDIFPDKSEFEVLDKDELFVLCSDGLIVDKQESGNYIKSFLMGIDDLERAIKSLVSYAYQEGSNDNITAVVFEYGKLKRNRLNYPILDYPPEPHNIIKKVIADIDKKEFIQSRNNGNDDSQTSHLPSLVQSFSKTGNNKTNRYIRIAIFLTLSLIIIVSAYFIFKPSEPKGKENINTDIILKKNELDNTHMVVEELLFKGFEKPTKEIYIRDIDRESISWYHINEATQYLIQGSNRDFNIAVSGTSIKISELGLNKEGEYEFTIFAITKNDKIKGSKNIKIIIK
ncbi:MAG: serine/threonine-protein phosphatase [Bacteroidetes bacterium]|nr:serine/threonine-protein phosphatase [Bacteroidota bacterium]